MRKKFPVTVILLTITFVISFNNDLLSIPAFARKYQISCQVCHSPAMPYLKEFGDDFAGNGFRMTEYESPRYFIPAGDDRLSLLRELPLAVRIDGTASFNFDADGTVDFGAPFVIKLLSGGELSDKLSYYFYFLLNERGGIAGAEDAFLMYHDLFGTGINFYIGQFQASDPLYKGELRYTLEPYRIYDASPGISAASLKYDRGIMLEKSFETGTSLVFEVLNGAGLNLANQDWVFDKDKYKNIMLRLNQSAGKVTIGLFGYAGRERFPGNPALLNRIWMAGPDISFNFEDRLIVNVQYMIRNDTEAFTFIGEMDDIKTRGGFAEIIFSPAGDMSKWYLTGLFNLVESDDDMLDYSSATLHAGYILRRNVRLVTEFTQQFSGDTFGRFNLGFVSAF